MINVIADRLAQFMATMPMADKVTGLVKAARIYLSDNQVGVFPIAYNVNPDACTDSELLDYCPDDTKASIIYFEDLGSDVISMEPMGIRFSGSLRLVCWFNYKRLSGSMHDPHLVAINILKYLPRQLGNFGGLIGVNIDGIRQEPNDASPFGRYTFLEERNQYVTYPYDYVSFILRAEWEVRPDCIEDITKTISAC